MDAIYELQSENSIEKLENVTYPIRKSRFQVRRCFGRVLGVITCLMLTSLFTTFMTGGLYKYLRTTSSVDDEFPESPSFSEVPIVLKIGAIALQVFSLTISVIVCCGIYLCTHRDDIEVVVDFQEKGNVIQV